MRKIKRHNTNSKTPWDNEVSLSPTQSTLVEAKKEIYHLVHSPLKNNQENDVFNSFNLFRCPYCQSTKIIKFGYTQNRMHRYKCKNCKRTFSGVTATIFNKHKIPLQGRIKFMLDLFTQNSTFTCAKTACISYNTAQSWLKDVFYALKEYQNDVCLKGENIQMDEIYLDLKSKSLIRLKSKIVGLKRCDKLCICLCADGDNVLAIYEGVGYVDKVKIYDTFKDKIKEDSTLIHDGAKAHNLLIKKLNLNEETYNWKDLNKLGSKDNPMMLLIRIKLMLVKFLDNHKDFSLDDIQDYLNLFCFIMNKPDDPLKKAEIIIDKLLIDGKLTKNELNNEIMIES